ncbi:sugar ABC transporter ATP-binding protein [bacterium]|nr:sugar ABC transporter ATP-binding protein [bacterium]
MNAVGAEDTVPRLAMRGIRKRFGATVALEGVDFAVASGEVHALVGENGAGKSTLVKVLSGAILPDAGRMLIDGAAFAPRRPLEARRAGVAMIYQELSLAPHLTVEENITLGMEPSRWGLVQRGEVRRRALDALRQLEHPEIPLDLPVRRLSVGLQQLVEIARALAVGCRILVLDEPTSSLSRQDIERLFAVIARLKSQGHAIVYISHFIEEVKRISDRYTVLRDGRCVATGATAEAGVSDIVGHMIGRRVEQLYPRSERKAGEVVLEIRELAGTARPQCASLSLRRGEVLGIAGLVGAGRTELLRAVFGLDPVRRGSVRVKAITGVASPTRRWDQGVGMLSEDRKAEGLALGLSLADNATLSRLPLLVLPSRQYHNTQRWIERLGIRCAGPSQRVRDLSGGNQQKIALARLLHHGADVLLLDEPTRGIDVASKALIYQLIDDLAAGRLGDRPCAVLIVSSYLPELLGVSDRIAVMARGRLGEAKPVSDWDEHSLMLAATGGQAA